MSEPEQPERPRVLAARFGANPNSSSLGVDVTFLLFGGAGALATAMLLGAWLRARRKGAELVGQPPPSPSEGGA